jgi:hypothetical protein
MTRRESEGKKLTDLVNVGFWEHVKKDNGDIEVTLADGETMTVKPLENIAGDGKPDKRECEADCI